MTTTTVCTGLTARWCPIHGNCTCGDEPKDLGWHEELDHPANTCPLHRAESDHAESETR